MRNICIEQDNVILRKVITWRQLLISNLSYVLLSLRKSYYYLD